MHERDNKLNQLMLGFEECISVFTMFLTVSYELIKMSSMFSLGSKGYPTTYKGGNKR